MLFRKKLTEIYVPILNDEYGVYVIWGDPKKAQEYVQKKQDRDVSLASRDDVRGITYFQKKCLPIIQMLVKPREEHFWPTLAHESCHAVAKIFAQIGEDGSKEVYPHSVAAIMWAVEKHLRKKRQYNV